MSRQEVIVGQVTGPHGIGGEVRVYPLTDFPERLEPGVQLTSSGSRLIIERVRSSRGVLLIKFKGVDDRDAAEKLRGRYLSRPSGDLPELEEGHFYFYQIIGLEVFDVDGNRLGRVSDILKTGSNDVYCVFGENREILIPALKDVVVEIDPAKGRIVVDPPAGLLDS